MILSVYQGVYEVIHKLRDFLCGSPLPDTMGLLGGLSSPLWILGNIGCNVTI